MSQLLFQVSVLILKRLLVVLVPSVFCSFQIGWVTCTE